MDEKAEVREFLTTRRSRIGPAAAGLPAYGGNRRVPGLRREEVAMLAGVSVDYYTRLERGNLAGVSESVLTNVSRALQLDDAEHEHLFDLARRANSGAAPRRRPPRGGVPSSIQQVLDAMDNAPAWVRNGRHDVLATNRLGRALLAPLLAGSEPVPGRTGAQAAAARRPANSARFIYLDPASREFWGNWERAADDTAAYLRTEAARNPHDKELVELIGELSTLSEEFRRRWAKHDVRFHRTGTKVINHPVVGAVELSFQAMAFPADPGLVMVVYTAAPGSLAADSLKVLASWAATQDAHEAGRLTS
ncbi:helix-turn-helix transcriptional regulator [Myceligenerans pegani]|uniref:Helix-turn-helix domain-containing protein n=1 Tax=Myceligenerans pegani TaxID=2776917 RepID=A0ABR9N6L8_9MICO|nr:helix-turn-helix transcriptional regulator [Myceligenerans sp. TRM 65318]MBE1878783.1 helix-turn-helix domain-containing protein [Myceligenerans sp. TRM 65318]MBE3021054.1 helix-turn-helix domain-containing protein [Myceligenerans sp. TRM 65318]